MMTIATFLFQPVTTRAMMLPIPFGNVSSIVKFIALPVPVPVLKSTYNLVISRRTCIVDQG